MYITVVLLEQLREDLIANAVTTLDPNTVAAVKSAGNVYVTGNCEFRSSLNSVASFPDFLAKYVSKSKPSAVLYGNINFAQSLTVNNCNCHVVNGKNVKEMLDRAYRPGVNTLVRFCMTLPGISCL